MTLAPSVANAQEETPKNRVNVSLMGGFPRLGGLDVEYFLAKDLPHVGFKASYGMFPDLIPEVKTNIQYGGVAGHYYFSKKCRGIYTGLEYGVLRGHASQVEDRMTDLTVVFHAFQGKLGIKTGEKVFFRGEFGYTLYTFNIDQANDFTNQTYGIQIKPTLNVLHLPSLSVGLGFRI